jgi:hypothetical protein
VETSFDESFNGSTVERIEIEDFAINFTDFFVFFRKVLGDEVYVGANEGLVRFRIGDSTSSRGVLVGD